MKYRDFLKLLGLGAVTVTLSSCAPSAPKPVYGPPQPSIQITTKAPAARTPSVVTKTTNIAQLVNLMTSEEKAELFEVYRTTAEMQKYFTDIIGPIYDANITDITTYLLESNVMPGNISQNKTAKGGFNGILRSGYLKPFSANDTETIENIISGWAIHKKHAAAHEELHIQSFKNSFIWKAADYLGNKYKKNKVIIAETSRTEGNTRIYSVVILDGEPDSNTKLVNVEVDGINFSVQAEFLEKGEVINLNTQAKTLITDLKDNGKIDLAQLSTTVRNIVGNKTAPALEAAAIPFLSGFLITSLSIRQASEALYSVYSPNYFNAIPKAAYLRALIYQTSPK